MIIFKRTPGYWDTNFMSWQHVTEDLLHLRTLGHPHRRCYIIWQIQRRNLRSEARGHHQPRQRPGFLLVRSRSKFHHCYG